MNAGMIIGIASEDPDKPGVIYVLNPHVFNPGRSNAMSNDAADAIATDLEEVYQQTRGSAPPVAHVLQYFRYSHLPEHLQFVSQQFARVAVFLGRSSRTSPELTVALRKLLEAKDAAVRNAVS